MPTGDQKETRAYVCQVIVSCQISHDREECKGIFTPPQEGLKANEGMGEKEKGNKEPASKENNGEDPKEGSLAKKPARKEDMEENADECSHLKKKRELGHINVRDFLQSKKGDWSSR